MRLSQFLRSHQARILSEWEDFARRLPDAPDEMSREALRDHARQMLEFIASDLDMPGTTGQQEQPVRGEEKVGDDTSGGQAHGANRLNWGFSIAEMAAEFRALRACVMRLWSEAAERLDAQDLIRFNEALDEALAESIGVYSRNRENRARLLEAMLTHSPEQHFVLDTRGNILFANRAMARAYDTDGEALAGQAVDALDPAFAAEARRQIRHVKRSRSEHRGDFTVTGSEGKVHVIEYLFAPITDARGNVTAVAGTVRDVTRRRAWERKLWRHANHDHLTGVPNRRLFLDRLEQDMRLARRSRNLLALLYVDLDGFKEVNDRLGHDAGDTLLREAAQRIRACTRETDTVARMGGDEFTVVLVDAGTRSDVEGVARAVQTRLSRPYSVGGERIELSGSVGIALYPQHGETADELLMHADEAMYTAKRLGGDRLHFYWPEDSLRRRAADDPSAAGSSRVH